MRVAHEPVRALLQRDVNVFVPWKATEVLTLTPGPVRWKLWMADLSDTVSLIFPAFVGFFAIVMVKPGPTVPLNVGVVAATPGRR